MQTFNYCLGRHAGTPLHHAAKRGLESIVKLLLLHGGMVKCLYKSSGLTISIFLVLQTPINAIYIWD
jgi:energy-converting hydrogenase Eha subunit C